MTESQYNQYNNLLVFAKDWRKYKVVSKYLDIETFRKSIQVDQYIKIECIDPNNNKNVYIYLFDKVSKYITSSQDLKKLLKKIKPASEVILVIYNPLGTYGKRAVSSFKNLHINVYRQEIFDLIAPKGPLCYQHRIMSREEIIKLTNDDLCCYITNLPKIFDEDTQCIWIGAKVGDVLEIKMYSDISGESINYRVVIPKSGKLIAHKEFNIENTPNDNVEEEDEEILEHREEGAIEDDEEDVAESINED
jgi:DNA-directed RNA polymerase subunit H (RpoH/RPB5)